MSLQSKFTNRLFRKIDGVVWDIVSGKLGINTGGEIRTLAVNPPAETGGDVSFQVEINLLDQFGLAIPAFALATKLQDVVVGDILVGANAVLGWITKINNASVQYLSFDSHVKTYNLPKVTILGAGQGADVLIVKNLTSLLGGSDNQTGFANSLMPLLMMGDGAGDLGDLMPILLMQSMGGGAASGAANPMASMLPLMLLSKGGLGGSSSSGGIDMKSLMLMQMMGGNGGNFASNPLLMVALMGEGGGLGNLLGSSNRGLSVGGSVGGNAAAPALGDDAVAAPILTQTRPPLLRRN